MGLRATKQNTKPEAPACPWAEASRRFPHAPAFIHPEGQVVSWAELDGQIEGVRKALDSYTNATLGRVVTNVLEDLVLLVAAMRMGRDLALFGPRSPRVVVEAQAGRLDARLVEGAMLEGVSAVESRMNEPVPALSGHTLVQTSGSTGAPRWIQHDASAHVASAAGAVNRLEMTDRDRWGWCLPAHHVGGLAIAWRCALTGAAILCPPAHTSVGDWIQGLGPGKVPTHLSLVPTQLKDLVESRSGPPQALATIIVGGSAVSNELLASAIASGWPIRTTYGMTETASMVTLSDIWREPPSGPAHAGQALPGADLQSRDGRLFVRSKALGRELADEEGWMPTSDRGYEDKHGSWVISGRMDRVIISGGENLDPDRIEQAIRKLPGVEACVVVSIPDDRYGQRPVAFLATATSVFDPIAVGKALRDTLASFEIPDAFYALPPLPEGETKWSRAELEALAVSGMDDS